MKPGSELVQKASEYVVTEGPKDPTHSGPRYYWVTGEHPSRQYGVTMLPKVGAKCTCKGGKYNLSSSCVHVIAVYMYRTKAKGRRINVWRTEEEAKKQRQPVIRLGYDVWLTSKKIKKETADASN